MRWRHHDTADLIKQFLLRDMKRFPGTFWKYFEAEKKEGRVAVVVVHDEIWWDGEHCEVCVVRGAYYATFLSPPVVDRPSSTQGWPQHNHSQGSTSKQQTLSTVSPHLSIISGVREPAWRSSVPRLAPTDCPCDLRLRVRLFYFLPPWVVSGAGRAAGSGRHCQCSGARLTGDTHRESQYSEQSSRVVCCGEGENSSTAWDSRANNRQQQLV